MIKLKNFLKSKTFYIVVSVLLGLMTWLLVLNYTNPTEKRSLEIPLNIRNAGTPATVGLSDRDSIIPERITVKVSGRADILGNLTTADLYATVDFAKITEAGTTTLKINEPKCSRLGVKIEDYFPKTIEVTYDKMSHANVDVVVDYDDALIAENFEILSVTAEPETIQISGFESDVANIDCIKVKLDESLMPGSIDSDKIGSYRGHYYLKSGEEVTADYPAENITVKIEVAKKVPVKYSVTGEPHKDCYLNKTIITSDTVLLRGAASDLRNIDSIELGVIDISGASSNVTKIFDITSFLPENVTVYKNTEVSVSAEILKYETKSFSVDLSGAVSTPGKNTREYTYEFSTQGFNIDIKGKASDLANLSVSSLGLTLDLTDKGVGEYILPLEFKNIDNNKFTVIGEYVCTVKIAENIEPTQAPETPTPIP